VLLTDATVGLKQGAIADTYALSATGTIQLIGVPGVEIGGTATVRFNNTGDDELNVVLPIAGSDDDVLIHVNDGDQFFQGDNLTIDVLGQRLTADLTFQKDAADPGKIVVAAADVNLDLGGGAITLSGGAGTFVITSAGLATRVSGTVGVNVPAKP